MANRYWGGGAGIWSTTDTTHWYSDAALTTLAGAVPTAADNVFFQQAATYTVTMTGALLCLDITVSAGTVTFATGTSPSLTISGSMSLVSGTVWTSTGSIYFNATTTGKTVTTNGTTLFCSLVSFDGIGGGWTLGSALTFTLGTSMFLQNGTLDTSASSYAITTGSFSSIVTTTRALILNASTFTFGNNASGAIWGIDTTGLTFNAGTSTIVCLNTCTNFGTSSTGTGLTFYNVSFAKLTAVQYDIIGNNTFNNLTVTAPLTTGQSIVTFSSPQTINGILSTTGTSGIRRVFLTTSTYGFAQTLTINGGTTGLTDADFRGIYVVGTAAPISGTRIGNRGECQGITFTSKTVYWNLAGAQNWTSNAWATTPTGTPSTDNFPLPQDTATFTDAGSVTGTITIDASTLYVSSVDMSGRTSAMTLSNTGAATVYGNWTNGSGTTITGFTGLLTFSGGTTQTITSVSKRFSIGGIIVDTYGGTVQLADDFSATSVAMTNGTFTTNNRAMDITSLSSNTTNFRTVNLGASTVRIVSISGGISFTISTNLTFNAGTSNIVITNSSTGNGSMALGSLAYYDVSYTNPAQYNLTITGTNTFNNLTFSGGSTATLAIKFGGNQIINETLTCLNQSVVNRVFLFSDVAGTQRTLTAKSISATDSDFRDIKIAGAAAGTSITRAGDCGNNNGIVFPAAKTVYWNLAGAQNWSATGWATSSGGTPAAANFPLAQDTVVFDEAGSAGTVTIETGWNIGTFNALGRTSAMTIAVSGSNILPCIYGDWTSGTGITISSISTTVSLSFNKPGTQTITSNGVQFGCGISVDNVLTVVQLADSLSLSTANRYLLTITAGTFNAVTYNVTAGSVQQPFATSQASITIKMGSGTWTLTGSGLAWNIQTSSRTIVVGTSTIVLSDNSTSSRNFAGGNAYYNKLTIGGSTGISTTTITGNNTFGELASTKTVAHTISFGAITQFFGKWSVTGTSGNIVTITGTSTINQIFGPAVTGVDFLAMGTWGISSVSPGEFYAGGNSTGTTANGLIIGAAPSPRTLYWVPGGTGNWSSTTNWSTTSGTGSGAAIPTSLDSVIFNSASGSSSYTVTIDAGVSIARCASFNMAGPASGTVTLAGSVPMAFHGNVTLAATGVARTFSGTMNLAGNSSYVLTTNGLSLFSGLKISGIGSTWTLGSAIVNTTAIYVDYGNFDTSASNYSVTAVWLSSPNSNVRGIALNGSTYSLTGGSSTVLDFSSTTNLNFNAGTSTFTYYSYAITFAGGGQTFYNLTITPTSTFSSGSTITGANVFNNLTVLGLTSGSGIYPLRFGSNQTINGTLTLGAGTSALYRTFLTSDTIGTQRTLTCAAISSVTDIDFRDINFAGAITLPVTGTRLGDCKGNSNITFGAAKTVYWANSSGYAIGGGEFWSLNSDGTGALFSNFPLAQDTMVFPAIYPASGSNVLINDKWNLGTIDMSLRTTNTMTLVINSDTSIYGNWSTGTGMTISGTSSLTFSGRTIQTMTNRGIVWASTGLTIDSPGGSVTLQDSWTTSSPYSFPYPMSLNSGTFDANGYNVTFAATGSATGFVSTGNSVRTLAMGSGTWSNAAGGEIWLCSGTNLTITGTATISLTSAFSKTFTGGGFSYSGITLNQAGAGALTLGASALTNNNTFANITNSYKATGATTIDLGSTVQKVNNFTASGETGRLLTIKGTSLANPGRLLVTSTFRPNLNYLTPTSVRVYPITNTWYAGANSTNAGSLGLTFSSDPNPFVQKLYFGKLVNTISLYYGSTPVSAIYYGNTKIYG